MVERCYFYTYFVDKSALGKLTFEIELLAQSEDYSARFVRGEVDVD